MGTFLDRRDAGRRLAERLLSFRDAKPVVIALPRGGAPVGDEIARALEAPLDILVARKLGAPGNPELAIGAIAPGVTHLEPDIIRALAVSEEYIRQSVAVDAGGLHRRLGRMAQLDPRSHDPREQPPHRRGPARCPALVAHDPDPDSRGQGIGTRLTQECLKRTRALGIRTVFLYTGKFMHAARHIYEKLSFQRAPELDRTPGPIAYRLDL